jgi:prepilin-type N-terminal cleavage/methylation domain-containing protein
MSKFSVHQRFTLHEGFSLIEVLVALGIFSIAILGLAVGAITITRANKTSQFHTVATNLAQDKIERLKALNAAAFSGVVTSCTSYSANGCSDTVVSSGATFTRSWQISQNLKVFAGVNWIDVKIHWTDYTGHDVTLSSGNAQ